MHTETSPGSAFETDRAHLTIEFTQSYLDYAASQQSAVLDLSVTDEQERVGI